MSRTVLWFKAEIAPGTSIRLAAREACRMASKLDVGVEFDFNDVPLWAYPDSDPMDIVREYNARIGIKAEEEHNFDA